MASSLLCGPIKFHQQRANDVEHPTQQPAETQEEGKQEGGGDQVVFPSSNDVEVVDGAENTGSVQFPASAGPVQFPTSDDAASDSHADSGATTSVPTPAVTFDANLSSPPRIGTPDPESEPKKKRMSAQNFQRLARRISITARRQSSSLIPGLKKDSSPRVSVDDGRSEGTDSPGGSIRADDKSKSKKDKKERKSFS